MKHIYRGIVIGLLCVLVWTNISSCLDVRSIHKDVRDIKYSIDRIRYYMHETMMDVDMIEWRVN